MSHGPYEHEHLSDDALWQAIAYNAAAVARLPAGVKASVREDGLQAAELVLAAAEFVQDEPTELL